MLGTCVAYDAGEGSIGAASKTTDGARLDTRIETPPGSTLRPTLRTAIPLAIALDNFPVVLNDRTNAHASALQSASIAELRIQDRRRGTVRLGRRTRDAVGRGTFFSSLPPLGAVLPSFLLAYTVSWRSSIGTHDD